MKRSAFQRLIAKYGLQTVEFRRWLALLLLRPWRVPARGLGQQELIDGVELGPMLDLARWTKESDSMLMF
jgi:hypothetical protein